MIRHWLPVGALLVSCGAPAQPTPEVTVSPVETAADRGEPEPLALPPPPPTAACRFVGHLLGFRDEVRDDDGHVIARLGGRVRVTMTEFEPAEERARVSVGGQRLVRLHGVATFHSHPFFHVAEDFDALDGHVVVRRGTTLGWSSLGEVTGDHISITVPTMLETRLQVSLACNKLSFDQLDVPRLKVVDRTGLVALRPQQRELSFHPAPGERPFWEVLQRNKPDDWLSVFEIGRRDGFVHARVDLSNGVALEGWIPAAQVAKPPPPTGYGGGHGSLCGGTRHARPPRVRGEWKPKTIAVATVARDAALLVGVEPRGAAVGVVEKGAIVRLGKRQGGFVAFELVAGGVFAPGAASFWVAVDALTDQRGVLEGEPYRELEKQAQASFDEPPVPSSAFPSPCRDKP